MARLRQRGWLAELLEGRERLELSQRLTCSAIAPSNCAAQSYVWSGAARRVPQVNVGET